MLEKKDRKEVAECQPSGHSFHNNLEFAFDPESPVIPVWQLDHITTLLTGLYVSFLMYKWGNCSVQLTDLD